MTSLFLSIALLITAFVSSCSAIPEWLAIALMMVQGLCIAVGYSFEYSLHSRVVYLEETIKVLRGNDDVRKSKRDI